MVEEKRVTTVSKRGRAGNAGHPMAAGVVKDAADAAHSVPSPGGCVPLDSSDPPQSAADAASLTLHNAALVSHSAEEVTVRSTAGATHAAFKSRENSSQQSVETPSMIMREGQAGKNPSPFTLYRMKFTHSTMSGLISMRVLSALHRKGISVGFIKSFLSLDPQHWSHSEEQWCLNKSASKA